MIIGVLKVVAPWVNAYQAEDVRTLELLNTLIGATISHAAHHASVEAAFNSKLEADRLIADEREALRARIRGVIDREAFDIAFQPVFALKQGSVVGFEALARFTDGRARSPDRWFDEALQADLSFELEIAVVRKALQSLAILPRHAYLAVNVSPETAASDEIARLCTCHSGDRIVLEITEHSSVDDYVVLAERARVLRRMGVRLAIDDAGAGFASLRHVLRLEPDLIKLDKIDHARHRHARAASEPRGRIAHFRERHFGVDRRRRHRDRVRAGDTEGARRAVRPRLLSGSPRALAGHASHALIFTATVRPDAMTRAAIRASTSRSSMLHVFRRSLRIVAILGQRAPWPS